MGTEERMYGFALQNVCDITPGPFINNAIGPFMPRIFIYFFGGLALVVMATSCFNYTNLSIARSLTRAKEIGVRKVNGASRVQIFLQFLSESVIISFVSLLLSLLLLILVKPFLLNLKFAQVFRWDLAGNLWVYGVFVLFSIAVGIIAGFFPSVILSRLEPMKVLRKSGSLKLFSRLTVRKALIVGQFALSLIFILSVFLLHRQLSFFVDANHGFNMEGNISIRLNNTSEQQLRRELAAYPNIEAIAASSHIPATGMTFDEGFKKSSGDQDVTTFEYFNVDEHYLSNMDLKLVAGKNFDPAAGESNKNFAIINEEATRRLGFQKPDAAIGTVLFGAQDTVKYEIIGVVKNYHHQVLLDKITPLALHYNPKGASVLQVKYAGSREAAVAAVQTAWSKVNPTQKIDYKDLEEEVKAFYETVFSDVVSIAAVISFMAISISCLGLLGMATYSTETRTKEISIRKVLGSDNSSLVLLLSKSFIKLLAVSIILAVPIAWLMNTLWLDLIAYKVQMDLPLILVGIAIILGLGLLTIGSQTLKAAFSTPVKALKND